MWASILSSQLSVTQATAVCACGGDSVVATTTAMSAAVTTMMAADTTMMAADTTTMAADTTTTMMPSNGPMMPSNGPDSDSRWLTGEDATSTTTVSDGDSDAASTTTTVSDAVSDGDSDAADCVCAPSVESTFVSTLSVADLSQIENFDLALLATTLQSSQTDWGDDATVVATAVFRLKTTLTSLQEAAVTGTECKEHFAEVLSLPLDRITCSIPGSDATTTITTTTTTGGISERRQLQESVSSNEAVDEATTTTMPNTAPLQLNLEIAYTTPTAALGAFDAIEDAIDEQEHTSFSPPSCDIDITWVVASEGSISAPTEDQLTSAVEAYALEHTGSFEAVVGEITDPVLVYVNQPCDVGLETLVCPTGTEEVADSATVGCAGAECDMSVDSGACCVQGSLSTSGANTNSMAVVLMSAFIIRPFFL